MAKPRSLPREVSYISETTTDFRAPKIDLLHRDDQQTSVKLLDLLVNINIAASHFLNPLEPEETFNKIVSEAIKLMNVDYGSIFLAQGYSLHRIYSNWTPLYKINPRIHGRTYQAFKKNEASYYFVRSDREPHPQLQKLGVRTVIYIPLRYADTTIGVMNMLSKKKITFSYQELEFLKLYGTLASLAIKKAQLYSETKNSLDNQHAFLALAAHEIKNPLTAITTLGQSLERKLGRDNRVEVTTAHKLVAETRSLNKLVEELLINPEPENLTLKTHSEISNLNDILERTISNFSLLHTDRKIAVDSRLTSPSPITGDPDKLLQVFINLLNNAVKYSSSSSQITLQAREKRAFYKITIKDHGVGIPHQYLSDIFQKFYRLDNQEQSGMGLGLYLVKRILDSHHGTIQVSSVVGRGTKVSVQLPKPD